MRFVYPAYLLLLIPVAVGLYFSFRQVHGMAKARKRVAFVVRFLLAATLIVALAGPESRRPNEGLCTIFVVDRSDSISDSEQKRANAFIDAALSRLHPDEMAGVIAFGGDSTIDAAPGGRRTLGSVASQIDGSASNIAGAIRLASATFPDGKARRIVVLSDGNETAGDVQEAATVSGNDGIPIDFVALGNDERFAEVSVLDVQAPSEASIDQPFDVRVLVDSTKQQEAILSLDRDGVLVKEMPVHLEKGQSSLLISDKIPGNGFHRYRAAVRAREDHDRRNNVGLGFVAVRGKPRILLLQDDPQRKELVTALRRSGVDVDLGGPGSVPIQADEFQNYDAIILNDFNAVSLQPQQMKLIQTAVRDSGIGLAMIGGENSFLPGGYYGTPIADALPVDLNIRQRKSFPSTSICIMVDASGSMGMIEDGFPKIRLAARAAGETVRLMSPNDRVAVAGSTDGIQFVAPMQKLTDKESVIAQIERLQVGGGGIYCQPSVEKAEEVLMAEDTQVRHFILLADGADCDSQEGCLQMAERMKAHKITTTAVAIGDGKDVPFLRTLAAVGGGRFYLAKHASQLPAIFTQDAAVMSRSAIEEGAFYPKLVAGEEILRGIDSTPPLLAYDLADSRPLARTTMKTAKDDPLLAVWQYGLGTSLAFTSDAQARWAQKWVGWEGFATFWAQATRAITRRANQNSYQVQVHQTGAKGVIEIKAFDTLGNPIQNSAAALHVAGPNGASTELKLSQIGPGTYTSEFAANDIGSYIVTVAESDGTGSKVSSTGFSIAYPAEYRSSRPNKPLLARMAEASQGQELSRPEQSLRPISNPGESISELWPAFLLIGAVLLPFDVAVRRIALPWGEIWLNFTSLFRRRSSQPEQAQPAVDRLKAAKQRAIQPSAPTVLAPEIRKEERSFVPREAPTKQGGETAANKLLEAKRKRSEK